MMNARRQLTPKTDGLARDAEWIAAVCRELGMEARVETDRVVLRLDAAYAVLSPNRDYTICLSIIGIEDGFEGRGHGSALLRRILRAVDQLNRTMYLIPVSAWQPGAPWLTQAQLEAWYGRYGFARVSESFVAMVREPQPQLQAIA